MEFLFKKLREPSTWATLTALLAAFGVVVDPGMTQDISMAGTGLAGIAGIFMNEKGGG